MDATVTAAFNEADRLKAPAFQALQDARIEIEKLEGLQTKLEVEIDTINDETESKVDEIATSSAEEVDEIVKEHQDRRIKMSGRIDKLRMVLGTSLGHMGEKDVAASYLSRHLKRPNKK